MSDTLDSPFLKKDIKRSFNEAAQTYDEAAFFQREVADRLIDRLNYIRLKPRTLLDLGGGTGYSSQKLEQHFKKAKIVVFDLAENMLLRGRVRKRWFNRKYHVCGEAEKLPFLDNSFDLVFSNLMLHWVDDVNSTLREINRVLKPGGLLLFSTLGRDTLFELRESWSASDNKKHVHSFLDMHHIGDAMQTIGFKDPVIDMEFITITYNDIKKILQDLKNLGTHNIDKDRLKGLTGKTKFKRFVKAYEKFRNPEGLIPLTYEVVYGLGWGKDPSSEKNEVYISIESIIKPKR